LFRLSQSLSAKNSGIVKTKVIVYRKLGRKIVNNIKKAMENASFFCNYLVTCKTQ